MCNHWSNSVPKWIIVPLCGGWYLNFQTCTFSPVYCLHAFHLISPGKDMANLFRCWYGPG